LTIRNGRLAIQGAIAGGLATGALRARRVGLSVLRVQAPPVEASRRDPDFDLWYPLEAALSLVRTPPRRPLASPAVPTLFVLPVRGVSPEYVRGPHPRLPTVPKRLLEVDDGVFWMCARRGRADRLLGEWCSQWSPELAPSACVRAGAAPAGRAR
jgi:hypothetical protein